MTKVNESNLSSIDSNQESIFSTNNDGLTQLGNNRYRVNQDNLTIENICSQIYQETDENFIDGLLQLNHLTEHNIPAGTIINLPPRHQIPYIVTNLDNLKERVQNNSNQTNNRNLDERRIVLNNINDALNSISRNIDVTVSESYEMTFNDQVLNNSDNSTMFLRQIQHINLENISRPSNIDSSLLSSLVQKAILAAIGHNIIDHVLTQTDGIRHNLLQITNSTDSARQFLTRISNLPVQQQPQVLQQLFGVLENNEQINQLLDDIPDHNFTNESVQLIQQTARNSLSRLDNLPSMLRNLDLRTMVQFFPQITREECSEFGIPSENILYAAYNSNNNDNDNNILFSTILRWAMPTLNYTGFIAHQFQLNSIIPSIENPAERTIVRNIAEEEQSVNLNQFMKSIIITTTGLLCGPIVSESGYLASMLVGMSTPSLNLSGIGNAVQNRQLAESLFIGSTDETIEEDRQRLEQADEHLNNQEIQYGIGIGLSPVMNHVKRTVVSH